MADEVIWGTKDFQVPEYFNFANVIDEWAQKEKVNDCAKQSELFLALSSQCISISSFIIYNILIYNEIIIYSSSVKGMTVRKDILAVFRYCNSKQTFCLVKTI